MEGGCAEVEGKVVVIIQGSALYWFRDSCCMRSTEMTRAEERILEVVSWVSRAQRSSRG